jgi:putative nucleotidyltransferase-like protein
MNLSNENKLLLYCTRTKIPEYTLNEVKSLVTLPLNWEGVLKSAHWHGSAPLLYQNLKSISGIPQGVMDQLKRAYYKNMARNMYLYAELRRILERFSDKGLDVIVLKGAALAEIVYGDIALRQMGDIDLLVRKEELAYAEEIMSSLNYSTYMDSKSQQFYRQNHFHLSPYVHRDKSIMVEIHHHIINHPFHINIDKWWERARETEIADCKALSPSPEDMLLHLCLHLFNHGYNKSLLRGICDISETLRYYEDGLNWTRIRDEVSEYGINKLAYSILYLVKRFYRIDSKLPEWLESSQIPIDLRLVSFIEKLVFIEDGISSSLPSPLVQFLATDKFVDKLKILLAKIFPSREVISDRYSVSPSSKKLYFYYLARPCVLFLKYGKFILEICRLKKEALPP